jgi:hypothetical protein
VATGLRHIIPCLILCLAAVTCVRVGSESGRRERASWKLVAAPPLATLSADRLRIVTLGHKGLYDDFATIWAIQFLADPDLKSKSTASEVYAALLPIANNRPRLESFYMMGCFVLALDFKEPGYCETLSIQGLKAFPTSWRIPMTQGFIATLIENNDLKAAAFYQLAASRENSPAYVAKLVTRLAQRGFADGQDLNETADMLKDVPGGTRMISVLRERISSIAPPARSSTVAPPARSSTVAPPARSSIESGEQP